MHHLPLLFVLQFATHVMWDQIEKYQTGNKLSWFCSDKSIQNQPRIEFSPRPVTHKMLLIVCRHLNYVCDLNFVKVGMLCAASICMLAPLDISQLVFALVGALAYAMLQATAA